MRITSTRPARVLFEQTARAGPFATKAERSWDETHVERPADGMDATSSNRQSSGSGPLPDAVPPVGGSPTMTSDAGASSTVPIGGGGAIRPPQGIDPHAVATAVRTVEHTAPVIGAATAAIHPILGGLAHLGASLAPRLAVGAVRLRNRRLDRQAEAEDDFLSSLRRMDDETRERAAEHVRQAQLLGHELEPDVRPRWRHEILAADPNAAQAWSGSYQAHDLNALRRPPIRTLYLWPFARNVAAMREIYEHGWTSLGPVAVLIPAELLARSLRAEFRETGAIDVVDDRDELRRRLGELEVAHGERQREWVREMEQLDRQRRREPDKWDRVVAALSTPSLTLGTDVTGALWDDPASPHDAPPPPDPMTYLGYPVQPLVVRHGYWKRAVRSMVDEFDLVVINLTGLSAESSGLRFELDYVLTNKPAPHVVLVGDQAPPPTWVRSRSTDDPVEAAHVETYLWNSSAGDASTSLVAHRAFANLVDRYRIDRAHSPGTV